MKVIVLYSSPNKDGLTAACAMAAAEGARDAGAEVDVLCINDLGIGLCQACNNGWGTCRSDHICQVFDGFQDLHGQVASVDGLVLVTPVYWGEMSESAKAFTDRFRRCEATRGEQTALTNKPVIAVAAAGGSGNGTVTCLSSMERWIQHVRGRVFDLVPVKRWTRTHKLVTIRQSAAAMVREASG